MIKKTVIVLAVAFAACIFVAGMAMASPTEYGMASAPQDQGNAISDTNSIITTWNYAVKPNVALETSSATKANVLNYWQYDGNLIKYNNIGHGDTDSTNGDPCWGLIFYDGEIYANTIQSLNPYSGLYDTMIFVNSCNSFENPLHDAFTTKLPACYIGGVVDLPMYSSEDTAATFWSNINSGQAPQTALSNAEQAHGTTGDFGYYGY